MLAVTVGGEPFAPLRRRPMQCSRHAPTGAGRHAGQKAEEGTGEAERAAGTEDSVLGLETWFGTVSGDQTQWESLSAPSPLAQAAAGGTEEPG